MIYILKKVPMSRSAALSLHSILTYRLQSLYLAARPVLASFEMRYDNGSKYCCKIPIH